MKQPAIRCFFLRLANALKKSPNFKFNHLKPPLIEKLPPRVQLVKKMGNLQFFLFSQTHFVVKDYLK